jgi:preprotein translocase subunit YajC
MISVAYAAGGPDGGTMSMLMQFAPVLLIFVVFYFLLIMPQQKKAKQHKAMLDSLDKGDEVITSGGIHERSWGLPTRFLPLISETR